MSNTTHEFLRETYRDFNARKIDAVLARLHPDVDWPNGMEGGREHGRNAVREYWTRQWGMVDPHVEPVRMIDEADGRTRVEVHQVVRDLDGKVLLDQMVHHVYVMRDGLIERMDILEVAKSA